VIEGNIIPNIFYSNSYKKGKFNDDLFFQFLSCH
jgi:hypothetical protein